MDMIASVVFRRARFVPLGANNAGFERYVGAVPRCGSRGRPKKFSNLVGEIDKQAEVDRPQAEQQEHSAGPFW